MSMKYVTGLMLSTALLFAACDRTEVKDDEVPNAEAPGEDTTSAEQPSAPAKVEEVKKGEQPVSMTAMEKEFGCFGVPVRDGKDAGTVIIQSQKELQKVVVKSDTEMCKDATLPEIDFATKTLVSTSHYDSGCDKDYTVSFLRDASVEDTLIMVEEGVGGCEMYMEPPHPRYWFVFDKLPESTTIVGRTKMVEE